MDAGLQFDITHLLAGGLVLVSFMLLYQDRMFGLLNIFALHAFVLALSVAWQALIQDAPHLYVTAAIALLFNGHHVRDTADHRIAAGKEPAIDRTVADRHHPFGIGRGLPGAPERVARRPPHPRLPPSPVELLRNLLALLEPDGRR